MKSWMCRSPAADEVTQTPGVSACDVTDLSRDVIAGASPLTRDDRRELPGRRKVRITTLDLTIKGYFLRMNVTQKCLLIVWPSLVRRKF